MFSAQVLAGREPLDDGKAKPGCPPKLPADRQAGTFLDIPHGWLIITGTEKFGFHVPHVVGTPCLQVMPGTKMSMVLGVVLGVILKSTNQFVATERVVGHEPPSGCILTGMSGGVGRPASSDGLGTRVLLLQRLPGLLPVVPVCTCPLVMIWYHAFGFILRICLCGALMALWSALAAD